MALSLADRGVLVNRWWAPTLAVRTSAQEVVGTVDAQKLRSSMTLFARAAPDQPLFEDVLMQYFDGGRSSDAGAAVSPD